MRYRPEPSVVAVRLVSMSASLVASTTTAGTGVPAGSLTEPAIEPWARAATGIVIRQARMPIAFMNRADCQFQFRNLPTHNERCPDRVCARPKLVRFLRNACE